LNRFVQLSYPQPFPELSIQPFVLRGIGLAGAPRFACLSVRRLAQPFPELLIQQLVPRGIGLAGAPWFAALFDRRLWIEG
jgi:hypothetical protein